MLEDSLVSKVGDSNVESTKIPSLEVSPLGSGLNWRPAGLLLLAEKLQSVVSAHGTLTLEIRRFSDLDALCGQLQYALCSFEEPLDSADLAVRTWCAAGRSLWLASWVGEGDKS